MKIRGFAAAGQAMTSVPTAFLANEMPNAPADYVKVYLYGLYMAGLEVPPAPTDIEERLHMTASEIENAFEYWQRRGVVTIQQDGTVHFGMQQSDPIERPGPEPFPYVAFNIRICEAFGRDLSADEFQKIYDWLETYSFPQEVAIMLVEHCIERKGSRVHINYMSKVAAAWAEAGVNTVEKAQNEVDGYKAHASGARQIMLRMGIRNREPGQTEMELYEKWTHDMGFTHEGIMYAMQGIEFTMSTPFKYLDGVLRNFDAMDAHTASEIARAREARTGETDEVKEALRMLGFHSTLVNREQVDTYRSWREKGHDSKVILLACAQATRYSNRRMEHATQILERWSELGLKDESEIRAMLAEEATFECQIQEVYQEAGIDREVRDVDMKLFRKYTEEYNMDYDVLMYAASLSAVGTANPLAYMKTLLERWAEANVTNVDEARAECEQHAQEQAARYGRNTAARDNSYDQRPPMSKQEKDERKARTLQILKERYGTT